MIKKGTQVRIKAEKVGGFYADIQRRIRDRVGVVHGQLSHRPYGSLVTFPPAGRKKEFVLGFVYDSYLEIIEEAGGAA